MLTEIMPEGGGSLEQNLFIEDYPLSIQICLWLNLSKCLLEGIVINRYTIEYVLIKKRPW